MIQTGVLTELVWHNMMEELCFSKGMSYRRSSIREDRSGIDCFINSQAVDYCENIPHKVARLKNNPYWTVHKREDYWWKLGRKGEKVLIFGANNPKASLKIQMTTLLVRIKLDLI